MIETGATIAFVIVIIAGFLAFLRLVKGPTLPDRIVALDFLASLTMAVIIIFSVISGHEVFVDIVMIISLVLFLGTVTIALYLKKKENNDN